MSTSSKYVIIVAGGSGARMKSAVPKQFLLLKGKPVLMHTINAFRKAAPEATIVLVLPEKQIPVWDQLCKEYDFGITCDMVPGGATRFHSVKNGLESIREKEGVVAVHDGVRPLVSKATIDKAFAKAATGKAAVPVIPVFESLRKKAEGTSRAVNREKYRLVQTPQCFPLELLKEAYKAPFKEKFTDDASVVEAIGAAINLVDGNRENIKITTPMDLKVAEALIEK